LLLHQVLPFAAHALQDLNYEVQRVLLKLLLPMLMLQVGREEDRVDRLLVY
jgi:hypothetical protein